MSTNSVSVFILLHILLTSISTFLSFDGFLVIFTKVFLSDVLLCQLVHLSCFCDLYLQWWWWWSSSSSSSSSLLQVIPVKVNYNYFTLYKASSLNLKIIWSKRVSFFVFLRCGIFIRRSHGSMLFAMVISDSICFYWNGWMKIDRSFWYTNHVQWHTNHVKEKVKSTITADS